MPSPFPGMDPYLERPTLWPDVHHRLIEGIADAMTSGLRPRYYVGVEERVYLCPDDDPGRRVIVPDVSVVGRAEQGSVKAPARRGPAVAEAVEVTVLLDEEVREYYLQVVEAESRQVVTVIEVLSPANKVHGSRGRAAYLAKRREVLRSRTHLVEIDLLRSGERFPTQLSPPPADYYVHVSRHQDRPRSKVWPIQLFQRLPVVGVPLKEPDPDFPLDLQSILNQAYDRAGYDLRVDYGSGPDPALPEDRVAWAAEVLAADGGR